LWGNLFELKKELTSKDVKFPLDSGDGRLQNKAFECIIEEYGTRVPESDCHPYGFQRNYKMSSTTIMD
jgi:protection of telomeres protein 1